MLTARRLPHRSDILDAKCKIVEVLAFIADLRLDFRVRGRLASVACNAGRSLTNIGLCLCDRSTPVRRSRCF